jgi:eukaryotic-like serine/threonine-protein kinase
MAAQTDASTEHDRLIGARLQKYEIRALIGQGGMGRVYEAWNPSIDKLVAIKVLAEPAQRHPQAAARFQREARAAGAIDSPFIVEIFDAGQTEEGWPFIVMELLRGETLAAHLASKTKLAAVETVRIASQVLRGLSRLHDASIVHRDLKPENIFLVDADPDPSLAKILDFGVSKLAASDAQSSLTREGNVLGTPAYMSPEQAQGDVDIDARSDLWAVGAVMYQCLTGRQPFQGSTYEQVIVRICSSEPIALQTLAPDCPDGVARAIERCLTKDPSERFSSAAELLQALGQPIAGPQKVRVPVPRVRDTTTLGSASTMAQAPVAPAGRRWWAGTAIASVVVMSVVAVWVIMQPHAELAPKTEAPAFGSRPAPEETAFISAAASTGAAPSTQVASASASAEVVVQPEMPEKSPLPARPLAASRGVPASSPTALGPSVPPAPSTKGVAGGLSIQAQ